jgi:hypothetical protein
MEEIMDEVKGQTKFEIMDIGRNQRSGEDLSKCGRSGETKVNREFLRSLCSQIITEAHEHKDEITEAHDAK